MIRPVSPVRPSKRSRGRVFLHFYIPEKELASGARFLGVEAVPHTDRES